MNVTINVVAYKWKVLKNNEIPLALRVTKDRKKKYIGLGISIKPEYWDFDRNQPKKTCPNKEEIQQIITERIKEYQEKVLEYKLNNKEFTARALIDKVKNPVKAKTVKEVFESTHGGRVCEGYCKNYEKNVILWSIISEIILTMISNGSFSFQKICTIYSHLGLIFM